MTILDDVPRSSAKQQREPSSALVVALAVAIVALLGGGVWAVTSPSSKPATLVIDDLRAASAAAKSQRSAAFEMTITMGAQSTALFTMAGRVDFERQLGSVEVDMGEAGAALGIERMKSVSSANRIWMRVPASRVAANAGRPWVSTAVTPGAMSSSDPSAVLAYLSSANGTPERVGDESVRGVSTTRFRSTLSVDTLLAGVPAEMREQVRSTFTSAGITSVPIEVWVDGDGLPRRIETKVSTQGIDAVSRMEMFDYGKPVDITVPSAVETNSVATLSAFYAAAGLPPGILG